MRLSARPYFFFLILAVFACGYANAGSIAKRDSNDDGALSKWIESIIALISEVPVVGSRVASVLQWIVDIITLFEIITNGALDRLVDGILPCTISLTGTYCSGLVDNGGFIKLLLGIIEAIPSILLPDFAKNLIVLLIEMMADSINKLLFGTANASV